MSFARLVSILILPVLLGGCAGFSGAPLATVLPTEYLPTAIALTLEAGGVFLPTAIPTDFYLTYTPTSSLTPTWTASVTPTPSLTPTPSRTPRPSRTPKPSATATPLQITIPPSPSATLPVEIPESNIQINQVGELSKVRSPIQVNVRLASRVGKVARVELFGEDGRLLARQVRVFEVLPWWFASMNDPLDFEISAIAEVGRLVVSVEDIYGRLIDLNSVNLILMSAGENEFTPNSTLLQSIYIQEPVPQALIIVGKVVVSGLARPNTDHPLRIELITQDGRVLGQRLAAVTGIEPGGFGTFITEVSYTVTEPTPVRLVVYEDGEIISPMTHLASVEIMLSP